MREYNIKTLLEYGFLDYADVIIPPKVDESTASEVYNEIKKLLEKYNLTFDSIREKGEKIEKEERTC